MGSWASVYVTMRLCGSQHAVVIVVVVVVVYAVVDRLCIPLVSTIGVLTCYRIV